MAFSSPNFPAGGYRHRAPNIQATGAMTGRLVDDSGGVTGYANAVLTSSVGTLTWEALAYLETLHDMLNAQATMMNTQAAEIARLAGEVRHLRATADEALKFIESLVTVPHWRTQGEVEMGDDMVGERPAAKDLGLVATYVSRRRMPGLGDGDIVRIEPVPGTLIRRGSPVVITVNQA